MGDQSSPESGPLPDAGGGDSGFVEGAHTLFLVPNQGGPVIAAPQVVTITYADDPERSAEEQLDAFLVGSSWFATVGKEYGVGNGTNTNVEMTETAPTSIDDQAIQNQIVSLVASGAATDPAADAGPGALSPAVYVFYVPTTTAVTVAGTAMCTLSGGGYHDQSSVTVNGHAFVYAVITECAPASPPQDLAHNASHELIESCTDPYPDTDPAYRVTNTTLPASDYGGEVGDLCSFLAPQWTEGIYTTLQRVYSNASVTAAGPPCIPAPEPWFATDVQPASYVTVAAGGTTTFQLKAWSSAPVAQWYLAAGSSDIPADAGAFDFGTVWIDNGESTTLQVTVPPGTPAQTYVNIDVFSAHSQTDYTTSIVGVYVP